MRLHLFRIDNWRRSYGAYLVRWDAAGADRCSGGGTLVADGGGNPHGGRSGGSIGCDAVLGWVSGGVRRLLKPLVRRELSEESWVAMGMNLTANLFGLGNAATPMGIRAAKLLAEQGENGLRGLTVLLVMNNSGLELMPATVMTLRQQAGSASPGDVWLPTLIATAASAATAALMLWFTDRR